MFNRLTTFCLVALLTLPAVAVNQIQQLVPFQGRLHNSDGNVVADGVYDLTFYLYDTATGGESLWSENHGQVSVIHGYVNVLLGATDGGQFEDSNVSFSSQKYLSISINGGQEMFPRHQLVPTFHAYNADKLGGKDANTYAQITYVDDELSTVNTSITNINTNINNTISNRFVSSGNTAKNADKLDNLNSTDFLRSTKNNDLVPLGTVLIWPASAAIPADYRECNGATLNKTTYSALYSVLQGTYGETTSDFKIPDYRGYFLRGWANGSSVDPDRTSRSGGDTVGSTQSGEIQSHSHTYRGHMDSAGNLQEGGNFPFVGERGGSSETYSNNIYATGGNETRPVNRAVMFIIKYK